MKGWKAYVQAFYNYGSSSASSIVIIMRNGVRDQNSAGLPG